MNGRWRLRSVQVRDVLDPLVDVLAVLLTALNLLNLKRMINIDY